MFQYGKFKFHFKLNYFLYLPIHLPTNLPKAYTYTYTHTRRHIITSHQIDDRAKISLNQLNPCKNPRKREIPAEKKPNYLFWVGKFIEKQKDHNTELFQFI